MLLTVGEVGFLSYPKNRVVKEGNIGTEISETIYFFNVSIMSWIALCFELFTSLEVRL